MNCERCGHPYRCHRSKCQVAIAYGWSEAEKKFAGQAPCLCPGYKGKVPGQAKCPHEYVRWQPDCVHCGHVRVAPKEEAT